MKARLIASHTFNEAGVCTTIRDDKPCLRRLADIASTEESDIGKDGIACYGPLSRIEYEEIQAYRQALWDSLRTAGSAGSR